MAVSVVEERGTRIRVKSERLACNGTTPGSRDLVTVQIETDGLTMKVELAREKAEELGEALLFEAGDS